MPLIKTATTGLDEVTGYDPERIAVQEEDTVEGRVAGIIAKNAPLQQLARTSARQRMGRRGLLNTSMAVGAGERAVIESALPIASQDAASLLRAKELNQLATGRAQEFTAGAANVASLQRGAGEQALAQIGAQGDISKELQQLQGEQQLEQIGLQGEQRLQEIGAEGQLRQALQEVVGTQTMEQITTEGELRQALQGLVGSQALQQISTEGELRQALQGLVGQQALQQIDAQGGISRLLQEIKGEQQLQQIGLEGEQRLEEIGLQGEQRLQEIGAEGDIRQQLLGTEIEGRKELEQITAENLMDRLKQQGLQDHEIQQLRGDQAQAIADIENQWSTLRQTSDSASKVLQQSMTNIGAILANPDIKANAKQSLINKAIQQTQVSMNVIGTISNIDLTDILGASQGVTTGGYPDINLPPGFSNINVPGYPGIAIPFPNYVY